MKLSKESYEEFCMIANDIINHEKFQRQRAYKQHGKTSVYDHVMNVALRAFSIAVKKRHKYNLKELVYGALLHDFFLYDWHIFDGKNGHKRFHGWRHPKIALINALQNWDLSEKEQNIIASHMWPLTLFAYPKSREAKLVNRCDKIISIKETLRIKEELELC